MAAINPKQFSEFCNPSTPADEDALVEAGVLDYVLAEHPDHLTIPELSLTINHNQRDFGDNDAVERAIRELIGAGLLRCEGGVVVPTWAAIRFCRLDI